MKKHGHQFGYTLLEVVVVLVIFSLLAGLAIPRLTTVYNSLQTAYQRDEVLARLGGLGYLAFQQGRDFDLTASGSTTNKYPLELPDGWQIHTEKPIHFFTNGACSGGVIYLNYQNQKFKAQLAPPFCEPQLSAHR